MVSILTLTTKTGSHLALDVVADSLVSWCAVFSGDTKELRSVTQGGIAIHSICSTSPEIRSEFMEAAGNGRPSASLQSLTVRESHMPRSAQCSLPADHGPCRVWFSCWHEWWQLNDFDSKLGIEGWRRPRSCACDLGCCHCWFGWFCLIWFGFPSIPGRKKY